MPTSADSLTAIGYTSNGQWAGSSAGTQFVYTFPDTAATTANTSLYYPVTDLARDPVKRTTRKLRPTEWLRERVEEMAAIGHAALTEY